MAGKLIEIDVARQLVLESVGRLEGTSPALGEALGRTLAEPVRAGERVPGFDNSAMDGYAVRAADVEGAAPDAAVALRVAGESRAGAPATVGVGPGEAIAISTGAALPGGADSVVRVEDTRAGPDPARVEVLTGVPTGANVRRAGEDVEPGQVLLEAGTVLGAAELGVLASIGIAEPSCVRRPRITIVSTGDELIDVGERLRPGAVRNSNAHALPALARQAGAEVAAVSRAPDDPEATVAALRSGLAAADVLVVCGGVSVGEHDHVKDAFAELGVERRFWGVSLKPGKPTWFGAEGRRLAFGLPGNPVSAYVTFLLFVRPALRALAGADPDAERTTAILTAGYEKAADRAHAIRCRLELGPEGWLATPAPQQGSHVMTSLLGADGLALVPAESTRLAAGDRVTVELLGRGGVPATRVGPS